MFFQQNKNTIYCHYFITQHSSISNNAKKEAILKNACKPENRLKG